MLLGVDPKEASRELFLSLVLPEDRPQVEWQARNLEPGAHHFSQFRIGRGDGTVRWIAASAVVRADAAGLPIEVVGINWDITEQKDAERQLVEAERRLSLATQAADIGIWDWNVETREFFYSARARQIYGFAADEQITFDRLRERTNSEDVNCRHVDIHSHDGNVLLLPQLGVLLAGDTLEDTVTYLVQPERVAIHLQELERMKAWDFKRILPCHGSRETIASGGYGRSLLEATQLYLQKLLRLREQPQLAELRLRDFAVEALSTGGVTYFPPYEAVHRNNVEALRTLETSALA